MDDKQAGLCCTSGMISSLFSTLFLLMTPLDVSWHQVTLSVNPRGFWLWGASFAFFKIVWNKFLLFEPPNFRHKRFPDSDLCSVPQLNCVGKFAFAADLHPSRVTCYNIGSDGRGTRFALAHLSPVLTALDSVALLVCISRCFRCFVVV
jgi:hypothetical protein